MSLEVQDIRRALMVDSRLVTPTHSVAENELARLQAPWWTSTRFRLAILCFCGFASLYSQRVNLSIAIVTMVTSEATNVTSNSSQLCPDPPSVAQKGEFNWSKELQGLILGAFFWGYLVMQVPGGWLAERYGTKKVVAIAMFPVAILNILSPPAARLSPYLFIVVRIIIGLGEGVMYPAVQAMWAHWAPPSERSRLIGVSFAGGQFGNALTLPIGGLLSAYGFDGGWASVFYVIGGLGLLWVTLWTLLAFDRPDLHPRISQREKNYIQLSLRSKPYRGQLRSKPWVKFFTTRAIWAIILALMCSNYGVYMMMTQIPTYMKEVLKFDIMSNGVYSMLPYLNYWLCTMLGSSVADTLIHRDILSITWTRKLFSALGTFGPALFVIGTGFVQCTHAYRAVILLTFAVGMCGFQLCGYIINMCDLAPAHAGTLFGICNLAASIPGIVAPFVVASMTQNKTQKEWQGAFFVAAAIFSAGGLIYLLLGTGELLPWGVEEEEEEEGDEVSPPVQLLLETPEREAVVL